MKMISNSQKKFIFGWAFLLTCLLPLNALAKLPPIDFATARLLKNRLPASYYIEISLLEKTITKHRGKAELFAGSFKVGSLELKEDGSSGATKLFAIAFGSQNPVKAVEASFSKLDKTRSVGVQHDTLTHRYGSQTRISIFRDSGALSEIRFTSHGKLWVLKVSDVGKSRFGTIYRSGVIVMRFTIRKGSLLNQP